MLKKVEKGGNTRIQKMAPALGLTFALLRHIAARCRTTPEGNGYFFADTKNGIVFHNSANPAFVTILYCKAIKMAPALGFEPRTKWLTATYSTAELCRSVVYYLI